MLARHHTNMALALTCHPCKRAIHTTHVTHATHASTLPTPVALVRIDVIYQTLMISYLIPVDTRYCSGIGFLLDLHRDIDQLRIETKVASLYDIFFQHHDDVIAIT